MPRPDRFADLDAFARGDREGSFELIHSSLGIGTALDLQLLLDGLTWRGMKLSTRRRKNEGNYDLSRQITSFEIVVA